MQVLFVLSALLAVALGYSVNIASPIGVDSVSSSGESRIVNGSNATVTQFPWQVSIRATNATGAIVTCGGAIISNGWVVTAAQCVQGKVSFQLGFGSVNINAPAVTLISTSAIVHPSYMAATLFNDIALIRLPQNLVLSATIASIRLPTLSEFNTTFLNIQGSVSGFGFTASSAVISTYLQYAQVRIINNTECSAIYGTTTVQATSLCTLGYTSNAQGACDGDGGSPLSIVQTNINTLVGIVSFTSSRGCTFGDPSGYTRTSKYVSWIQTETGIIARP